MNPIIDLGKEDPGMEKMETLYTEKATRRLKNNQILCFCLECPRENHPRRGTSWLHSRPSRWNQTLNDNFYHNRWHGRQCMDEFQINHCHRYTNGNKSQEENPSNRGPDPKGISQIPGRILWRKSSMIPWITLSKIKVCGLCANNKTNFNYGNPLTVGSSWNNVLRFELKKLSGLEIYKISITHNLNDNNFNTYLYLRGGSS